MFCADLVRHTGAMAARLGGMDALFFTGGAGAGQPLIRQRVAAAFGWAGVALDPVANDRIDESTVAEDGSLVSDLGRAMQVWGLPVDEETRIAREVAAFAEVPS